MYVNSGLSADSKSSPVVVVSNSAAAACWNSDRSLSGTPIISPMTAAVVSLANAPYRSAGGPT
jgi:hypothetical protein